MKYKLILASNSPRREDFIRSLNVKYTKLVAEINENIDFTSPIGLVTDLSKLKAKEVFNKIIDRTFNISVDQNLIILGADTIVELEGNVLGKPKDREDARKMISSLSKKEHLVITGVSLLSYNCSTKKESINTFYSSTKVHCSYVSDEILSNYLDTNEWKDKAGGYGIQGQAQTFIDEIQGSYSNVVGLPLTQLIKELSKLIHKDGDLLDLKSSFL
jgi:septum formation protein